MSQVKEAMVSVTIYNAFSIFDTYSICDANSPKMKLELENGQK